MANKAVSFGTAEARRRSVTIFRPPVRRRRRLTGRRPSPLRSVLAVGASCFLAVAVSACGGPSGRPAGSPVAAKTITGTAPPPLSIVTGDTSRNNGDIFIAPAGGGYPAGPEILTTTGKVVWFHWLPAGEVATDFRTQTYLGQPVLTWFQSAPPPQPTTAPAGLRSAGGPGGAGPRSARTARMAPTTSTTSITSRSPRSELVTTTPLTSTSSSSPPGTPLSSRPTPSRRRT